MKEQIIGGIRVNVIEHVNNTVAVNFNNLDLPKLETLKLNLSNKYNTVKLQADSNPNGYINHTGYFICK